jgi:hypothetical protein
MRHYFCIFISLMRKTLIIVLICVHLFGNTEMGQLFRLPQLITHFFEHERLDPSLNFFEFLAMHYAGDDGTTADDDLDNQLPYHNVNYNTIAVVYSPMVKDVPSIEFSYWETKVYDSRLLTGITPKHVLLILQPPKQA